MIPDTLLLCSGCRGQVFGTLAPSLRRIAINGDGPTYLYQCELCASYWDSDLRFTKPISEEKARQFYRAHFADWSPPASLESLPRIRKGSDFMPIDALLLRNAPPEGDLEHALTAGRISGEPASVLPFLHQAVFQVPSTTEPAADGSGMTPIALNRPPVIWVFAFTCLELARRFAEDGPYCLEFAGSDLLARLPEDFGLHLNYGTESSCQLKP